MAVYGCASDLKWAYLLNLSTTKSMTLLPIDLGSPSMKSMDMSSHTLPRICIGCNRPGYGEESHFLT